MNEIDTRSLFNLQKKQFFVIKVIKEGKEDSGFENKMLSSTFEVISRKLTT